MGNGIIGGQTASRNGNEGGLKPIRIILRYSDRIKFIHCFDMTSCAVTMDGRSFYLGKS